MMKIRVSRSWSICAIICLNVLSVTVVATPWFKILIPRSDRTSKLKHPNRQQPTNLDFHNSYSPSPTHDTARNMPRNIHVPTYYLYLLMLIMQIVIHFCNLFNQNLTYWKFCQYFRKKAYMQRQAKKPAQFFWIHINHSQVRRHLHNSLKTFLNKHQCSRNRWTFNVSYSSRAESLCLK